MDRPSSSSRSSSFDGPGSRPILVETGPSKLRTDTTQHPTPDDMPTLTKSTPSASSSTATRSPDAGPSTTTTRPGGKANVASACGPCKRAHLACDVARPCKRCVNMGKEELCEDVPHKKRGRPKNQQPNIGPPFPSIRRSSAENLAPWRPYDPSYRPLSPPRTGGKLEPDTPQTFTLFTSTDLNILRATHSTFPISGWYQNEMINQNVRDYVHPEDIRALDEELNRLLQLDWLPRPLSSRRDVHIAIPSRSEVELLSPAEGMSNSYPNQNVRILHSNKTYSLFNVRFHIGGAFGANLWIPDTIGNVYVVVSFLPLSGVQQRRAEPPRYPTKLPPLPPISTQQALPPLSSIHSPSSLSYPRPPPLVTDRNGAYRPPYSSRPPDSQTYYRPPPLPLPPRRRSPSPVNNRSKPYPYPEYPTPPQNSSYPYQQSYPHHPVTSYPQPRHSLPSTSLPMPDTYQRRSSEVIDDHRNRPPSATDSRRAWEL